MFRCGKIDNDYHHPLIEREEMRKAERQTERGGWRKGGDRQTDRQRPRDVQYFFIILLTDPSSTKINILSIAPKLLSPQFPSLTAFAAAWDFDEFQSKLNG